MAKQNGSGHIFAFASRLLRSYLVVVTVVPICHANVANLTGLSVTPPFDVLECPVWIGQEQSVYFSDVKKRQVIRYLHESGETTSIDALRMCFEFLVPVNSNKTMFVGGDLNVLTLFSWDGSSSNILRENSLEVFKASNELIQCGKPDSVGRLWIGSSFSNDVGKLYMVDITGKVTTALDNIGVPRDVAWCLDDTRMYIIDGTINKIVCYVYDKDKGVTGDFCQESFDFNEKNCLAYHMTIDTAGHLWVSCFGSPYVLQIDVAMGQIMTQVNLPESSSSTSVVFGGKTMEDLYVTTDRDFEESDKFPKSGTLFQVTKTGYKGKEFRRIDVNWPKK